MDGATSRRTENTPRDRRAPRREPAALRGPLGLVEAFGKQIHDLFEGLGRFFVFLGHVLRNIPRRPYRWRLLGEQVERIGVRSVPIIALSSMAIGMIFSLQITMLMAMFQAETIVGAAVTVGCGAYLAAMLTAYGALGDVTRRESQQILKSQTDTEFEKSTVSRHVQMRF